MITNINLYCKKKDIKELIKFINPLQEQIVFDESRLVLINGCAGSRKTDTIIKKGINYITMKKNILFLTFVSSVSNEIKTRIEQTLKISIPKIGLSNHYLTQYENNFIEIANIDAWIHKQLNWIESNLTNNFGNKRELSVNFNNKVLLLKKLTSEHKYYNIILKNNEFADVILIDEFQDTDITKVELLIDIIRNNLNLDCVVAGDILQTIFVDNIGCKNFKNPMLYFKNELKPTYYEINTCFRCPAPHINFVNYLLGEQYKLNGLGLIISQNSDKINKPVLFGHDCISHNETAYKLATGVSNAIITILKLDPEIKPDDIAILMKKSNSNYVFEHIKNILPLLFKKNNIYQNNLDESKLDSYVIHFETNGDGYSNTINWEKSINKTVLVSIHGDKGKGHKVVFFLGLSKKSIPSDYNIGKPFEIFDISLLNVALTRSLKYLFIGFTLNSPSVYLSSKHIDLDKYCYLAWDKNIHSILSEPGLQVYLETIKELNKYWFDKLCPSKQKPKFDTLRLLIPTIPIKTILKVSQDISKDLSLQLDKIISNIFIEEDCIDLYEQINFNVPDSFYKIFGFVGELLLMRNQMILTNSYGYFGWILNIPIYYTNLDNLINYVYDYNLNKYINDVSIWKEKLLEIELDLINKQTNLDYLDYLDCLEEIRKMENYDSPVLILNNYYIKHSLETLIKNFCSKSINNTDLCNDFKSIIILGLFYAEINSDVRKDFLYLITDKILHIKNLDKIILQIESNSKYIWENYLVNNEIEFQKNISIDKKIVDKKILQSYGFTYSSDRIVFKKGLKLSIKGICDVYNVSTNTLIEIKTCLKTSFSNEWVLQIIVYNLLLKITNQIDVKNNYIVNLFDGSIYKINFESDIKIIKSILKFYEFDDFLIDFLIG